MPILNSGPVLSTAEDPSSPEADSRTKVKRKTPPFAKVPWKNQKIDILPVVIDSLEPTGEIYCKKNNQTEECMEKKNESPYKMIPCVWATAACVVFFFGEGGQTQRATRHTGASQVEQPQTHRDLENQLARPKRNFVRRCCTWIPVASDPGKKRPLVGVDRSKKGFD